VDLPPRRPGNRVASTKRSRARSRRWRCSRSRWADCARFPSSRGARSCATPPGSRSWWSGCSQGPPRWSRSRAHDAGDQRPLPRPRLTTFRWRSRVRSSSRRSPTSMRRAYPAAEMKHGPIALIDDLMPVVFLAPKDAVYQKVVSNVEEVEGPRRSRDCRRERGGFGPREAGRPEDRGAGDARPVDAGAHGVCRCSCSRITSRAPGLQRRPAKKPGEVGDGGVKVVVQRASRAEVRIAGKSVGKIERGSSSSPVRTRRYRGTLV